MNTTHEENPPLYVFLGVTWTAPPYAVGTLEQEPEESVESGLERYEKEQVAQCPL